MALHSNDPDNIIKVISEMMTDRGFPPTNTINTNSKLDIEYTTNPPILIGENELGELAFAFWVLEPKLGVHALRKIMCSIQTIPEFSQVIIVCEEGSTSFTEKQIKESDWADVISVFKLREVRRNITKHSYVPKHTRCNSIETHALLKKYNILDVNNLPLLYRNDPIAQYYKFTPGDIIRIDRRGQFQTAQPYFRLVVNPP